MPATGFNRSDRPRSTRRCLSFCAAFRQLDERKPTVQEMPPLPVPSHFRKLSLVTGMSVLRLIVLQNSAARVEQASGKRVDEWSDGFEQRFGLYRSTSIPSTARPS